MSGQVVMECFRWIETAEDIAADKLGDGRESKWERLDELFEDIQDNVLSLHNTMERQIKTAKAALRRSLRRSDGPSGPSGLPKNLFGKALWYTRHISGLTDSCTRRIIRFEEKYDQLCFRRRKHFAYRRKLWKAHLKLFAVGAYVSGAGFPANKVGTHCKVDGDIETQVKFGTYVHVDEDADGCMPRMEGIEYDDNVPYGPRGGIIRIGRLYRVDPDCRHFSAIVSKKSYDRVDGLDDDDCACEDTFDHHELHYYLVILG